MKTVVLDPAPLEIEEFLARRKALGQDLYDEIWDGEYHVTPAPAGPHAVLDDEVAVILGPLARAVGLVGSGPFNLGRQGDFRVPDRGYHRQSPSGVWSATAALVVEILSPDDETYQKLAFYAAHLVDEVLILDPASRRVEWLARRGAGYGPVEAGSLLPITAAELTEQIRWP